MERSLVIVLTLVTLVAGTPHGYGVKGGASAKAEASAVAGAFGGLSPVPLSIPSGSGYSGSFSKSSSSSFASSSASSSASSFSFNGSGANGIAGIGTDKGCSTGTCPGSGTSGPSSNGDHQFTGANAASAAQAKSLSGSYTPCQGSSCNGSPSEKCTSGQCQPNSGNNGQSGCAGIESCLPLSSESKLSGSEDKTEKDNEDSNDSNDFSVNINRNQQSKLSHDSNGQYSNQDKSYNPVSDCSNGNCGGQGNSDQTNLGSNQNKPPAPSTYLTAPNTNPPCTTPNCKYSSQNGGSQSSGLPSSYNVPIQSATNPPTTYYLSPSGHGSAPNQENSFTPGVPCTSPSCNSTPYNVGTSNIPNYQPEQQGPGNQGPCTSGQCGIPSSSNGQTNNDAVSGNKVPYYSHGSFPSHVPSGQPGCTGSYCSGTPTHASLPANQPGNGCNGAACSGSSLTASPTKLSDANAPVYTGGFGGPPGFLDINSGYNKVPGNSAHDYSHNTPGSSRPTGSYGSTPTLGSYGTTNSNNNFGSTQSSSNGGATGAFDYNKPSKVPSTPGSQFNPSNIGSYGSPTASSALPLGSLAHSQLNGNYKPTTSHSGSSPAYSGSIDGSSGSSQISSGSNSIQGSYGISKPNTPSGLLSTPAYAGGFGVPSGASGSKPGSSNCGSADCNGQSGANVNGGSYDKTNPSNSQNKPAYTGGFGGPAGILNPNNVNVPSNTPTVSSGTSPCATGNCGSKGTLTSSQGSSITGVQNLASATASANAAVYSGGFGGPPGFLSPYDDGKVDGKLNTQGLNGNLANGHSPSSNAGHPNTPSVTGKDSEPGNSANGANAAAHASAAASAIAGSYGGNNHNGSSRGCNSGCSPDGAGDSNLGIPVGLTKSGFGGAALASAKSNAAANAFGNFASSSASAHASAGAATKGGYGRK